jgi:hypothetical protein
MRFEHRAQSPFDQLRIFLQHATRYCQAGGWQRNFDVYPGRSARNPNFGRLGRYRTGRTRRQQNQDKKLKVISFS